MVVLDENPLARLEWLEQRLRHVDHAVLCRNRRVRGGLGLLVPQRLHPGVLAFLTLLLVDHLAILVHLEQVGAQLGLQLEVLERKLVVLRLLAVGVLAAAVEEEATEVLLRDSGAGLAQDNAEKCSSGRGIEVEVGGDWVMQSNSG